MLVAPVPVLVARACHHAPIGDALDALVRSLGIEAVGRDLFRGTPFDDGRSRLFGGLVVAQSVVAAASTVGDSEVHAAHASFLRAGDPLGPLTLAVERQREGRASASRYVTASQGEQVVATLTMSFHRAGPGPEHQLAMPAAPEPESLPAFESSVAPYRDRLGPQHLGPRPVDVRFVTEDPFGRQPGQVLSPAALVWLRADGPLPDEPLLHAAILAYASDLTLVDTIRRPHGLTAWSPELVLVTLNHAIWFHRPARVDEWLLYDQESPVACGGRAVARGFVFARDGALVATVVQESLARPAESDEGARSQRRRA